MIFLKLKVFESGDYFEATEMVMTIIELKIYKSSKLRVFLTRNVTTRECII